MIIVVNKPRLIFIGLEWYLTYYLCFHFYFGSLVGHTLAWLADNPGSSQVSKMHTDSDDHYNGDPVSLKPISSGT